MITSRIIYKIPVRVLKGFEIDLWQENQNFNYAFHQHYTYKGEIIDGIERKITVTL